jgi:hypothetical protein
MPTSRVMFYKGNGIKYCSDPTGEWADDDYFTELLKDQDALNFRDDFIFKTHIPPYQIHKMYPMYLDKKVCGKVVSEFRQDLSFTDYVNYVKAGKVVMTSGQFTGQKGLMPGHAFCVVGIDDNECLLLADPYGDWSTEYASEKGYLVPMSFKDYVSHVKPLGSELKWGHVPLEV